MRKHSIVLALAVMCGSVISCSEEPEADNSALGLCKQVMELTAKKGGADEDQKLKYLEGCHSIEAMGRGASDWKCVLGEMKQGADYIKATAKCFGPEK